VSEQAPGDHSGNADDPLATAFRELERNWESDDAHRRFIALCATHGALDEAGRRYNGARTADPARAEDVARRLQQVTAAALEQLAQARSVRPARGRRLMWLMVGICGFVVIQAFLTLLRVRSQ
jgi:hypothetical protein